MTGSCSIGRLFILSLSGGFSPSGISVHPIGLSAGKKDSETVNVRRLTLRDVGGHVRGPSLLQVNEEEIMIRKSPVVVLMLLGRAVALCSDQPERRAGIDVSVRMLDQGLIRGSMRVRAMTVASEILGSAGIRLRWADRSRTPETIADYCAPDAVRTTITVRFLREALPTATQFALASTLPFSQNSTEIVVYYDRLQPMLETLHYPEYLLGHVLAHEIGHGLMRTDAHATNGVMKARWSVADIHTMSSARMEFTPEHALLMRMNLLGKCTSEPAPFLVAGTRRR
jgi:hypothetical protein